MELNLALSIQEQNDNKALILTDTTTNFGQESSTIITGNIGGVELEPEVMYEIVSQGSVNFTGLGAYNNTPGTRFITNPGSGNIIYAGDSVKEVTPTVAEIIEAYINTTVTGVSGVADEKLQVDLYIGFSGPWTLQSELVYTITSLLLDAADDNELEDGIYEITYNITYNGLDSTGTHFGSNAYTETLNVTVMVSGQAKAAVYEKFRQIPTLYDCNNKEKFDEISEIDLMGAYYHAIEVISEDTSEVSAKSEELLAMLVVLTNMLQNGATLYY